MRRPPATRGHVLAGAAIIAGAIGIGLVEALGLPKGLVWLVVALTLAIAFAARSRGRRR
ncbi:MAG TPA: hypothetical protein VIE37_06210 [Methylomirabilota bacterium]|jgi:hypothetical protein